MLAMFYVVRISYSKKEKWSSINIIGNLAKNNEMMSIVEPIITKLHLIALLPSILRIHHAATAKITKFIEVDTHILVYIGSTMFGFPFISNLITQGSQI